MSSIGPTGWIRNDDVVEEVTIALAQQAGGSVYADDQPSFVGQAERLKSRGIFGNFPHLAEKQLFGQFLPPFHQRRGTCTSQGTGKALRNAWYDSLVTLGEVGVPVDLAIEFLYGVGRTVVNRSQYPIAVPFGTACQNCGDGCTGAELAFAVHDYGCPPRGVYGGIDLSQPREDLSILWGNRGNKIPDAVMQAASGIMVNTYRCRTRDAMVDAAATPGVGLAFCGRNTFGPKDKNGISRLNQPANHCTAAGSWAVSIEGRDLIGGAQSWGRNTPSGPLTLTYKGGTVEMPDGMCFVDADEYWREVASGGEMWAFQFIQGAGYRSRGPRR